MMTEQEWRMAFAERFGKVVRDGGRGTWFQKDWVDMFEISENTISRYRRGHTTIDAYTLYRIAQTLGCSMDDLANFD